MPRLILVALAVLATFITPVLADDWTAQKLRGTVLELVNGAWQKIERGAVVPESHVVRTMGNARVVFVRGSETVELGPDTQVAFYQRDSDRFTTVQQYFGEVTVEADVEKVKHFAVQTPHLAAVVKGTVFVVRSDDKGASVEVKRGAVAVHSSESHESVTVLAGQQVESSSDGTLDVSGEGTLPVVVDQAGKPVDELAVVEETVKVKTNNGKSEDKTNNGKSDKDKSGKDNSGKGKSGKDDSEDDEDDSEDDSEDDEDDSEDD
jgi:hypothetical protein